MSDESTFRIVNFDASLIGAFYNARQQTNSVRSLPAVPSNVSLSRQNDLETPWAIDEAEEFERLNGNNSSDRLYRLLVGDYNEIQNKENFIDRRADIVRDSDLDVDSKSLFILYNALKDLKTIADYAGDPRTSSTRIDRLEEQFQLGLGQVKDFIKTERLDELSLLYGEKSASVTSKVGLGRAEFDYIGPVIHTGEKNEPISSLEGGESFTISITKRTTSNGVTTETNEDIDISIPVAEESRTLDAILTQINTKIQATKTTDDEGEVIPLFNTAFFAEEVADGQFALRVKTDFTEKLSFSAADTEPAIYITGNAQVIDDTTKQVNSDIPVTAFITKLSDLDSAAATTESDSSIIGKSGSPLLVPLQDDQAAANSQFINAAETTSNAVATDSKGYLYSVGSTQGEFANHLNGSEDGDAFLNKYDASGKLIWSRLIGSAGEADSFAVTVDGDDNIIVSGQTDKLSAGDNVFSGKDSFISKYDNVGTQQWIYQNDTFGTDAALAITTDSDGDVYVTGRKNTLELSSTVFGGDDNAYVLKLDGANGTQADYVEIGSSASDFGQGVAVAADGNIVVSTFEDGNLVVQKLDKDNLSSELWSYDYGDLGAGGAVSGVVADGSRLYVTGSSQNTLTGGGTAIGSPNGELDGFVLALDDLGNSASADYTKFIGTAQTDQSSGITVSGGKIYLAGTTGGAIDGTELRASTDSFATRIDATTGATDWIKQLGVSTENRNATGVAFATLGTSVLTKFGLPIGEFEDDEKRNIQTQTTAQEGDYFFVKVNNGSPRRIEIKDGDTFRTLANRINRTSFRYIKASVSFSSGTTTNVNREDNAEFDAQAIIDAKVREIQNERNGISEPENFEKAKLATFGNSLRITGLDGGRIEIISGRGEQDALRKLGLEPTKIFSSEELFDLDEDTDFNPDRVGGIFAFKLDDRFSVKDQRDARFVAQELDSAINIIQSAYRSLTFDPIAEQIKQDALRQQNGGRVPPALQKQLANYQDGLRRISALVPQGGGVIT